MSAAQASGPWGQRVLERLEGDLRDRVAPDVLRRIRHLQATTLAVTAVALVLGVVDWSLGLHALFWVVVAAVAAAWGNLLLLRRTLRARLCGHLALALLLTVVVATNVVWGGFYDPNFAWFYTLPLAAAVVLDVRGAWIWAGVTLASAVAFWLLPQLGIEIHSAVPVAVGPLQGLASRIGALLAVTGIASAFVAAQRRAELELGDANASLAREKRYVELLRSAAVSANEASTLDEAMRESLRRICHVMGWPCGHVYWADERGVLRSSGILWAEDEERIAPLWQVTQDASFAPGEGVPGRAQATRQPIAVWDLAVHGTRRAALARELGLGASFAIPVVAGGHVPAVLELCAPQALVPDEHLVAVLGHVGEQLGRVVVRTGLQDRLRQSQKLEAVGQLAAGLAHEINNPMAYVKTNLNLLRETWARLRKEAQARAGDRALDPDLADGESLIEESLEGVDRTIEIVRDVKDFSRAADGERSAVDWNELLDGALRVAAARAPHGVAVERELARDLPPVHCAPGQIRQVLVNLIVNALQAVRGSGRLALATRSEGEYVVAAIADNGPGIPESHRRRLFEPFFTTKPVGEGTGLGLYVSYEIVSAHGGEIRVHSEPGSGSCFELRIPWRPPASTAGGASSNFPPLERE